jgi:hypothetical protein
MSGSRTLLQIEFHCLSPVGGQAIFQSLVAEKKLLARHSSARS